MVLKGGFVCQYQTDPVPGLGSKCKGQRVVVTVKTKLVPRDDTRKAVCAWEFSAYTPGYRPDRLCSKKLHLQSYLEILWSETGYFGLLGKNLILFIILLYLIER